MLDFLCASTPRYDTGGDGTTPAPLPAPTVPGLLDGLGLSALFVAPTPAYVGQAVTAHASSPGLLCWLFGSPTPHYQAATPKPSTPAQQSQRGNATGR